MRFYFKAAYDRQNNRDFYYKPFEKLFGVVD